MGTYYGVQFAGDTGCDITQVDIDRRLEAINDVMSTYRPDSELSLINQSPADTEINISSELRYVLQAASELWRRSGGAFDVTVGPLVNLWGFGPEAQNQKPTAEQQAAAATRVGMDKLDTIDNSLSKQVDGLYIDLSALAKGYAVDEIAVLLSARGCNDYMVDIGGEIRVAGVNARGKPWRVGIEVPDASQLGLLQTVVSISDISIATSGDYRNYRVVDGQRIDHVLDPRTGKPANNRVVSATVLHPSAMWADGYATALMVLGMEEGMRFAQEQEIAAYLMAKSDNSAAEEAFESRYTAAMKSFLSTSE
jgi:FAD:protein FMN transferase